MTTIVARRSRSVVHQFRDQTHSVANDSKWPHAAQRYVRTGTSSGPAPLAPTLPHAVARTPKRIAMAASRGRSRSPSSPSIENIAEAESPPDECTRLPAGFSPAALRFPRTSRCDLPCQPPSPECARGGSQGSCAGDQGHPHHI